MTLVGLDRVDTDRYDLHSARSEIAQPLLKTP